MRREEILTLLYDGFTHSLKDPLWGNIRLSSTLKDLIENKRVQKLARIKQNGPTYHIYPGSVHTRLDHSIGVYHLSRMIILSLASKNEALPLSKEGIMSFLVASLLHDIGHFPYAHSLKELSIKEHESIAAELILSDEDLYRDIVKTGANAESAAAIIDKSIRNDDEEIEIYRKILSGPLDPDKLDYLSRDAYFSGVPYGTQNTDYIILALEEKIISFDDLYLKDDDEFDEIAEHFSSFEPFTLIDRVKHNDLLEKKAEFGLDEYPLLSEKASDLKKRGDAERIIFNALRKKYPGLKEYETIIDIPEPINFESSILLLHNDGSVSRIRDDETVLSSSVGSLFSSRLRKLSIFLPYYVSLSDAKSAVLEGFNGRKAEL